MSNYNKFPLCQESLTPYHWNIHPKITSHDVIR